MAYPFSAISRLFGNQFSTDMPPKNTTYVASKPAVRGRVMKPPPAKSAQRVPQKSIVSKPAAVKPKAKVVKPIVAVAAIRRNDSYTYVVNDKYDNQVGYAIAVTGQMVTCKHVHGFIKLSNGTTLDTAVFTGVPDVDLKGISLPPGVESADIVPMRPDGVVSWKHGNVAVVDRLASTNKGEKGDSGLPLINKSGSVVAIVIGGNDERELSYVYWNEEGKVIEYQCSSHVEWCRVSVLGVLVMVVRVHTFAEYHPYCPVTYGASNPQKVVPCDMINSAPANIEPPSHCPTVFPCVFAYNDTDYIQVDKVVLQRRGLPCMDITGNSTDTAEVWTMISHEGKYTSNTSEVYMCVGPTQFPCWRDGNGDWDCKLSWTGHAFCVQHDHKHLESSLCQAESGCWRVGTAHNQGGAICGRCTSVGLVCPGKAPPCPAVCKQKVAPTAKTWNEWLWVMIVPLLAAWCGRLFVFCECRNVNRAPQSPQALRHLFFFLLAISFVGLSFAEEQTAPLYDRVMDAARPPMIRAAAYGACVGLRGFFGKGTAIACMFGALLQHGAAEVATTAGGKVIDRWRAPLNNCSWYCPTPPQCDTTVKCCHTCPKGDRGCVQGGGWSDACFCLGTNAITSKCGVCRNPAKLCALAWEGKGVATGLPTFYDLTNGCPAAEPYHAAPRRSFGHPPTCTCDVETRCLGVPGRSPFYQENNYLCLAKEQATCGPCVITKKERTKHCVLHPTCVPCVLTPGRGDVATITCHSVPCYVGNATCDAQNTAGIYLNYMWTLTTIPGYLHPGNWVEWASGVLGEWFTSISYILMVTIGCLIGGAVAVRVK